MNTLATNNRHIHIHFIGVGGAGMSGLAHLALDLGFVVSGSDLSSSTNTAQLEERGLTFYPLHRKENLSPRPSLVVVSSAIAEDNVEYFAAKASDIPIMHRSEFLKDITKDKKVIAVSGTHGKSSTAALIYYMLNSLGLDPGYYLGAPICNVNRTSSFAKGNFFVLEADESDGSFLNFWPFISVITNIDDDHLDYYENAENVGKAYLKFMSQTDSKDGNVIINWDDNALRSLSETVFPHRIGFGSFLGADIRLLTWASHQRGTSYRLMIENQLITNEFSLLGEHNVKNMMAALSVAYALKLDLNKAAQALASFPGIVRRCQFLIRDEQANRHLIDDYAHNPGKIHSTLKGLKKAFPHCFLTAIFQPHRYSRFQTLYSGFLHAFSDADKILVCDIYSAGEPARDGPSPTLLVRDLNALKKDLVAYMPDRAELKAAISSAWQKDNQVVVFMGAGDINKTAFELKEILSESKEQEKEYPKKTES